MRIQWNIFYVLAMGALLWTSKAGGATVAELQGAITTGNNVTIIDIRSPELYARSHIPNAINIPATVVAYKNLPHFEKVIVYGGGIRSDGIDEAAAALAAKQGNAVEVLNGGYAAWQSAHSLTTAGRGVKPEAFNYISYKDLKAANVKDALLVDLRRQKNEPLSDLRSSFPGMRVVKTVPASDPSLTVLIDNGDGAAVAAARQLKASGNQRYAILVGGELIVARDGRRGSQRKGSQAGFITQKRPNP